MFVVLVICFTITHKPKLRSIRCGIRRFPSYWKHIALWAFPWQSCNEIVAGRRYQTIFNPVTLWCRNDGCHVPIYLSENAAHSAGFIVWRPLRSVSVEAQYLTTSGKVGILGGGSLIRRSISRYEQYEEHFDAIIISILISLVQHHTTNYWKLLLLIKILKGSQKTSFY